MRRIVAIVVSTIAASASGQSLQLHAFLTARGIYVRAQPSWTEEGFGRFDVGATSSADHRTANVDVAQIGIAWTPTTWLLIHGDGLARKEPADTQGRRAGLVQAFADLHNDRWRLRGGAFWLPTSRENVDPLWNSRYTITYSALNSWIGQEVRPVGIDLQYSPSFYFTLGATAFRGNDTMGTELAARGWTFGNRLSLYNEELPQPSPKPATRPIGQDLDGKNGYSERIRISIPERAMLQVTHIDNRAALVPNIKGQTPWLTRFNIVGGEWGSTATTTLAGERASGSTAVGFPGGSFTMDFETAYLLLSHKSGADRWSARVERFSTRAHRRFPKDSTREHGHAVTVAWFHNASEHARAGVEYSRVSGDRPAAPDPRTGGSTITVELRYGF